MSQRITHGSVWLDKRSSCTVGVLAVCAHDHDCDNPREPIVSGTWHGHPSMMPDFAMPEEEFRQRFVFLAEEPEAVEARVAKRVRDAIDALPGHSHRLPRGDSVATFDCRRVHAAIDAALKQDTEERDRG